LKALQAARTSPLVQQRQTALNDITTRQAVGQWDMLGYEEMKSPTSLQEAALL